MWCLVADWSRPYQPHAHSAQSRPQPQPCPFQSRTQRAVTPLPVTPTAHSHAPAQPRPYGSHAPSSHANSAQLRPGSATPLRQPRTYGSHAPTAATPPPSSHAFASATPLTAYDSSSPATMPTVSVPAQPLLSTAHWIVWSIVQPFDVTLPRSLPYICNQPPPSVAHNNRGLAPGSLSSYWRRRCWRSVHRIVNSTHSNRHHILNTKPKMSPTHRWQHSAQLKKKNGNRKRKREQRGNGYSVTTKL